MFTYLFKFLYLWLLTNLKNAYLRLLIFPTKKTTMSDHITTYCQHNSTTVIAHAAEAKTVAAKLHRNFVAALAIAAKLRRSLGHRLACEIRCSLCHLGHHVAVTLLLRNSSQLTCQTLSQPWPLL